MPYPFCLVGYRGRLRKARRRQQSRRSRFAVDDSKRNRQPKTHSLVDWRTLIETFQDTGVNVRDGSWPCKNAFPRIAGEKPGPVRSQATIAAISGLIPTMFMSRFNESATTERAIS